MGILIQNGTIVTADRLEKADVLVEGSTIREVFAKIDPAGHTIVDASGLFVLPGGIDAHTHMDMPFGGTVSADDFLTGTRAAAIGGTTTIVDFAIQAKGTRMRDALDIWRSKAEGKACIDYGLHMIVTDLGSDNGKQGLQEGRYRLENTDLIDLHLFDEMSGLRDQLLRIDDRASPYQQG